MPRPKATHTPSTPICQARRRFFSPKARHGRRDGVGQEVHEAHDRGDERGGDAHARELRFAELADKGESVSTKMASAMSAPKAGTARARMRRFSEDWRCWCRHWRWGSRQYSRCLRGRAGSGATRRGATGRSAAGFSNRVLLCAHPPGTPRRRGGCPGAGGCTLRDRRARRALLGARPRSSSRARRSLVGRRCLVRVWRPGAWRGRRGGGRKGLRSR